MTANPDGAEGPAPAVAPEDQQLPATGLEDQFRLLFERNPCPMWVLDRETGRFLAVNDAAAQSYGYSRDEFLSLSMKDLRSGDDALDPPHPEEEVLDSPTSRRLVRPGARRHKKKDGGVIDVEIASSPIMFDGSPALLVLSRDMTVRRRVEKALEESEERYRRLVEISPDTVLIHREGRITFVNPAGARLFGAGYPERMIGFPILDIVHPDHRKVAEERIRSVYQYGLSTPLMEQKWVRLDGSTVEVEVTGTPFIDEKKPAIQVIARDITKRRIAQRAARESHERFLLIARATNDLVWDWDFAADTVWWNDGVRSVLGYAPEEVDPSISWWYDRIHPEDRDRIVSSIHAVIDGGERFWSAEYRYRRADGTYAHFYDRGYVLREESGKPMRMIGAMLDVTERKQAEQKLRFQADVLSQVKDVVIAVDNDERVIHWNSSAERLYGYPVEEVLGRPLAEVVRYRRVGAEDEAEARTILESTWEWHRENVHLKKSGEEIFVESSVSVLRDEQGAPIGFLGVIREVTERKRAERERARLFEEVREGRERLGILSLRLVALQEAERREIARELHDEIGQQLTGLKLILEMKEQRRDSDEAAPEAQRIVQELMDRVRELSMNLRPPMLDDLGLVPALLWHLERYTVQTGIQIEFHHAGIQRFAQEVETGAFRIVQEALTNVARHGRARRAKVMLRSGPERLQIVVEDEGAGFDAKTVLERTWGGIAGMRERARLLGGSVDIDSSPGAGTRLSAEIALQSNREREVQP